MSAVRLAIGVPTSGSVNSNFMMSMLALMGIDHHRLSVKYQGLDVRLTGVAGKVVQGIMA